MSGLETLREHQRTLLDRWLPGATVVRDHSWGLVERRVLEVHHETGRYVVKAGGADDHHMPREIEAHRLWLRPWTARGRAPQLAHADEGARLLVTRYLPGSLVMDSRHASDPAIFRQAGHLLALLHHQQRAAVDEEYEARERDKALAWLEKPHRIPAQVEQRLRDEVTSWPTPPALLVPTHGDWQPRNWLVHDGAVSVIDLGRAALRPALSDFARLASGAFHRDEVLEHAFLEGYGADPREPGAWHRQRVREAIGTAVWAHLVGDEPFEAQGHRMIAQVLAG